MKLVPFVRVIGVLEGASLLILLFIAMPLKYIGNDPSLVRSVGMIHGVLFIIYIIALTIVAQPLRWSLKTLLLSYILSSVPFGTFYFDHKYLKKKVAL